MILKNLPSEGGKVLQNPHPKGGIILQKPASRGSLDSENRQLGANFRVTLFGERVKGPIRPKWQSALLAHFAKEGRTTTQEAARLWKISPRNARGRLLAMVKSGLLVEVGRGPTDPYRVYVLKEDRKA